MMIDSVSTVYKMKFHERYETMDRDKQKATQSISKKTSLHLEGVIPDELCMGQEVDRVFMKFSRLVCKQRVHPRFWELDQR